MVRAIRDPGQGDLLAWQAPEPVARFETGRVRAATIAGLVSRAVSEALATQGREDVAAAMSAFLGRPISKNMLDAYASAAREEHVISVVRFVALLQATMDMRLLQVIADQVGWAVIDKKFLPVIELASLREHEDAVKRRRQILQAQAKASGAL